MLRVFIHTAAFCTFVKKENNMVNWLSNMVDWLNIVVNWLNNMVNWVNNMVNNRVCNFRVLRK